MYQNIIFLDFPMFYIQENLKTSMVGSPVVVPLSWIYLKRKDKVGMEIRSFLCIKQSISNKNF